MSTKGGKREGAGRKSVEEETKVKNIIINALKTIYKVSTDDEAKKNLIVTLMESQRGQIFISEHLFGKPKETIEQTHNINDFSIKEALNFGKSK